MSRWKVKRVRLRTGGWGEWAACNDDEPWMYFLTHAGALTFADQRARTIEVTLPRLTALPTGRLVVPRNGLIIERGRSSSHPQLPTGYIAVEPWELRPLALALLAIAQHKEEA
ncbi:hypothetical protein [Corynebacterium minutissimum]|uniref:Uncharacterized protein n=1 Tax=Corynebacterium minutissimum TaxID=38301 RepID=A0A376CZR4_9CORY|nr:hypothetical protein [Corynebacterium minutissimum]QRP60853.1 hypothetical protein I6J26_12015 [Corynebacterium minutissimum]STC77436.1 Uncharacterised protein [Corynebacterium minutissimum]